MTDRTPEARESTTDQILDLLLDALIERQKARRASATSTPRSAGSAWRPPAGTERAETEPRRPEPEERRLSQVPSPRPDPPPAEQRRTTQDVTHPAQLSPHATSRRAAGHKLEAGDEGWEPPARLPSIDMGKMLLRLAILVAVLIALVNIPVNRYGTSLARILPESEALVIRDGLVLKGSRPEIYILENDRLRWISSMDAFEHRGLTWEDVHVVEDSFLNKFQEGPALHVLLKCGASPHIYRLENDQKRWIRDIDAFTAEGHVWDDVRFVSCDYLRNLPTGPSIPEDAGPAPEP